MSQANKVESVKRPKIVRVDEARAHACGGDQERESIAPTRRAPPFRSVFRRYGSSLPPPPRETPRASPRGTKRPDHGWLADWLAGAAETAAMAAYPLPRSTRSHFHRGPRSGRRGGGGRMAGVRKEDFEEELREEGSGEEERERER